MDQLIINLYDEYTHKPLTREVFLKKLFNDSNSNGYFSGKLGPDSGSIE